MHKITVNALLESK